jgi:RNA polymerase sigma factor (sigma-70 family)
MIPFINKIIDDDKIIEGLQIGGPQRHFYEKELYKKYLYFISLGVKKHRLPVDDVSSAYSDTIIILIDNIVSGKFEGRSSLKSYAFQIFSNRCVDLIRKITTNKSTVNKTSDIDSLVTVLPDKTRSVIQGLIDKNLRSLLLQKLNEIGEKCKSLLLLFEDGYSDKEIAGILAYNSADVVKTSRLRCLEKLKQKVLESSRYE